MDENNPAFFTQSLPEETKKTKKRITRRRILDNNPTKIRRVTGKKKLAADTQKINQQLNDIYRDENGKIPDMSNIRVEKKGSTLKKIFIFLFITGLLAAAAWTGFFMMPQKNTIDNQITITINGPEKIIFGATTTYEIKLTNSQKIKINNPNLTIRYPASFVFVTSTLTPNNQGNNEWRLTDLSPRSEQKIKITGYYYGTLKEEQSWRLSVRYQPENFKSELQLSATKNITITDSPFTLTVTGPDKAAIGSEMEYLVVLEDRAGLTPAKFIIQNELPNGFTIITSTPSLNKNLGWSFLYQPPTSSASILPLKHIFKITGKFTDNTQQEAAFKSILFFENQKNYQIDEANVDTELIKNLVSLQMAVNGSLEKINTRPGEMLNVTLSAKNESPQKITRASINIAFDAPAYKKTSVIDWAKIADRLDGDVIGKQITDTVRQGKITWTKTQLNTLNNWKNGQEIQIEFQIPIKDLKAIDWGNITTNQIVATPEITFTDASSTTHTISGKPLNIIINSDLSVEVRDEIEKNDNTETHNINWVITNNVHPLNNVSLSADLYGNITVSNPITAPAGQIIYDTKEQRLTWEIPHISLETDVLALPFTITINQKNPTQNLLVSKVRIQADDASTGEKLEFMAEEIPLINN